jgi:hypothetical protein
MPNWCENDVLIRGPAEEIKRYKDSLLKDATGKYYPWLSTVPLPELKDEAEVEAYVEKEPGNKTAFSFGCQVIDLEVVENNPRELELHFRTAYSKGGNLCTDELFPELSILHKYFEPMNAYHGFAHYVKGELIASGHEVGEEQDSPWQMYDYNPRPSGVNPLVERLKNYIIIPVDMLRSITDLLELPEMEGLSMHRLIRTQVFDKKANYAIRFTIPEDTRLFG